MRRATIFKFLLLMIAAGISFPCHAITCNSTPPLNMGTFARLDDQSGTYAVDTDGDVTKSDNIKTVNQPTAGVYYCVENANGNNGYYWAQAPTCTQSITPSGCAATVAITFIDPMGIGATANWTVRAGETRSIPYGISLIIPQTCPPGAYSSFCTPTIYGVNGKPASNATLGPINFTFTVVAHLAITEVTPLHFGVLASKSTASQVTVSYTGERTGTAILMPRAPHATAAEFQITGTPNTSFSVSLPPSVTLQNASGATLTVSNFVPSTGALTGLSTSSSGTVSLGLGGTLAVPANAPQGTYTGELGEGRCFGLRNGSSSSSLTAAKSDQ